MIQNFISPKAIIGFFVVVVLGVAIGFRGGISRLLDFGSPRDPAASAPSEIKESEEKQDAALSETPNVSGKMVKISSGALVLSYSGRNPSEIRPVPEEVKLFTENQKERLYASIQTHAQAVKTNPTFFDGWIQIGILKKIIGDFEGARDAWEYASVIEPMNSLSFANLGELYWRYIPDYPKAEKNLKISIAHKPDDVMTYVSLADLYHYSYKEKYDLVDDALLDGLKANQGSEYLMRHLAYIYELRGEFANAAAWWQNVLEKAPQDQELISKIEKLKEGVGAAGQ